MSTHAQMIPCHFRSKHPSPSSPVLLEPTAVSAASVYPKYKRVELLTLRRDTATLAVIYLVNGNVEKKITHSITSDEEPGNIYTEMIKKMESEQLVLKQTEALKDDIEDLLRKKFYHSTD